MSTDNTPDIKRYLLAAIPRLRAMAIGLCGKTHRAEDLVQEAVTRG